MIEFILECYTPFIYMCKYLSWKMKDKQEREKKKEKKGKKKQNKTKHTINKVKKYN